MAASAESERAGSGDRPALGKNVGKAKRRAPMTEQGTLWPDGDLPPVRRLKKAATFVTDPRDGVAGGLER
jgi:hypothetical protein